MSNIKNGTPVPVHVETSPVSREDRIGDFEYDGERTSSRFYVSFMFKGTPTELMESISRQGALHVATEDIKGVTVKEKGRVQFRNRKFRSR